MVKRGFVVNLFVIALTAYRTSQLRMRKRNIPATWKRLVSQSDLRASNLLKCHSKGIVVMRIGSHFVQHCAWIWKLANLFSFFSEPQMPRCFLHRSLHAIRSCLDRHCRGRFPRRKLVRSSDSFKCQSKPSHFLGLVIVFNVVNWRIYSQKYFQAGDAVWNRL